MRIYFPNSDVFLFIDEKCHAYTVVRNHLVFNEYIDGWEKIECVDDPNSFHLVFRDKSGKVFFPTLADWFHFEELTPDRETEMRAIRFCVSTEANHLCFLKTTTGEFFQSAMVDFRDWGKVMFTFSTTMMPGPATQWHNIERPHMLFIESPPE